MYMVIHLQAVITLIAVTGFEPTAKPIPREKDVQVHENRQHNIQTCKALAITSTCYFNPVDKHKLVVFVVFGRGILFSYKEVLQRF